MGHSEVWLTLILAHDCLYVPTSLEKGIPQRRKAFVHNKEKERVLTLFWVLTFGEMLHKVSFWSSWRISHSQKESCVDINVFI